MIACRHSEFTMSPIEIRLPKFTIERESQRRPLKARASVRSAVKGQIGGRLVDISEQGCKIELFDASVKPGHRVVIKLETLEIWVGYVRWIRENVAGVYFERPMHSAIVDHLSKTHPIFEMP